MVKVVLIRHGESQWNLENRFTGWTDVPLSEKGVREASEAGKTLRKEGYTFDKAYTSVLRRAIGTLNLVLGEMELDWLPVTKAWQLNERHYGALQGLNKSETADKYGEEQVKIWRRSFDVLPPALGTEDPRWPGADPRYAGLTQDELPVAESLKTTIARVVPFWENVIVPEILAGRKLIIAAHGNSLRALVKYLDKMADEDVLELNIPTGIPLVYELDEKHMAPIRKYYLGDEDVIRAAVSSVLNQGKAKN